MADGFVVALAHCEVVDRVETQNAVVFALPSRHVRQNALPRFGRPVDRSLGPLASAPTSIAPSSAFVV